MGREARINYEQVAAAADAMTCAGIKPTSRGIRERLGNVGSMGTVNKLMQDWKAARPQQQASPPPLLPPVLSPVLQRVILDFMAKELSQATATLTAQLAGQQQKTADLAKENERQALNIEEKNDATALLRAELATLQGRLQQSDAGLAMARDDALRERGASEDARIELAKTQLMLKAVPRLEADLGALRLDLDKERQGRMAAEKQAAILAAKLEAANERIHKAEAVIMEADKAEASKNALADLSGKLDALQEQIERQAGGRDAARAGAEKEPRGKTKKPAKKIEPGLFGSD